MKPWWTEMEGLDRRVVSRRVEADWRGGVKGETTPQTNDSRGLRSESHSSQVNMSEHGTQKDVRANGRERANGR